MGHPQCCGMCFSARQFLEQLCQSHGPLLCFGASHVLQGLPGLSETFLGPFVFFHTLCSAALSCILWLCRTRQLHWLCAELHLPGGCENHTLLWLVLLRGFPSVALSHTDTAVLRERAEAAALDKRMQCGCDGSLQPWDPSALKIPAARFQLCDTEQHQSTA